LARRHPDLYRAHGIELLGMKHPRIQALKRRHAPSVHGHKPWTSSFLVMDFLAHRRIPQHARVMEIGCGWGPVAVFCAKRFAARVTGVDIDPAVFPFLEALAAVNDVEVATETARFERLTTARLGREHLIVGSDICFWDELADPLYNLVRRAQRGGARRVIIADPGRAPFHALVERCRTRFATEVFDWHTGRPTSIDGEILDISL